LMFFVWGLNKSNMECGEKIELELSRFRSTYQDSTLEN
jgi:hypothetical protein